jgi:hypothetical protein
MVSRTSSLLRILIATAALLPGVMFGQTPTGLVFKTIEGDPLKINVAADASFQVYNSAVPGRGQAFPSGCIYGDMGVFANIGGTLFAPSFGSHTCGTATGGLGAFTPWTKVSISEVIGAGEGPSPFTVTVNVRAGDTGVSMNMIVTYVNGDNFFRLRKTFTSAGNRSMKVFVGADIYLGGSDAGIFFVEPTLHAPGGTDCGNPPTYHILFIPINPTPASRLTTATYSSVWQQIGLGVLNNNDRPGGCVDNGAAIQFDNVLRPGMQTATVQSAISFGSIPRIEGLGPFVVRVDPDFAQLNPGETAVFNITVGHNAETEFNSPIELSTPNLPEGMTATFDRTTIPAPGDGTARLTVHLAPDIFPATYRGISVLGTGGGSALGAAFTIEILCDPPVILALNNPRSQSVKRGNTVKLSVKAEGSPATYQWYQGHAGFTSTPIPNSNSAELTTTAINTNQEFWVRVSNACGTVDSQTAMITPFD